MFWRWRKTMKTLPYPEGPYSTGSIDFMDSISKDSLFIRFTYPVDVDKSELNERSKQFVSWLADEKYLYAFAKLLNLWVIVLKILWWFVGRKAYIPTLWEEPVSKRIKKFPVVVFSHGYGSTRFLCSTVCNELASRGYIVAALEHKDESASITYYYKSEKDRDKDNPTYILGKKFHDPSVSDHYMVRNKQLRHRSVECSNTLNLLADLNEGKAANLLKSDFDIQSLKGKIDLASPVLMGHSFGGATTMYTLSVDKRFKQGIILDGWMFPMKSEKLQISQPMLFINTHTFHLEANIKMMKKFVELPNSELFTMRNTTHESNTDTPIIHGYWLNIFMKKLPSRVALKIQNYLILQFLHKHTGLKIETDLVKKYLEQQSSVVVSDFVLYSTVPMKKFSVF